MHAPAQLIRRPHALKSTFRYHEGEAEETQMAGVLLAGVGYVGFWLGAEAFVLGVHLEELFGDRGRLRLKPEQTRVYLEKEKVDGRWEGNWLWIPKTSPRGQHCEIRFPAFVQHAWVNVAYRKEAL